ncbi:MAG: hypothetical protein ACYDIB_01130 [Desulfobulbia bacterium]|nr:MAG: hypothetical protein CVU58_01975 [Deltaproteobacteria bacterium HGW-Deltaproteobacteria-16]
MKATWEKVLEYSSMPVQGTMSRKLRKGVSVQVNEGKVYEKAVIFLGEEFVRITEEGKDGQSCNTYYDWAKIDSVRTCSAKEKE